MTEKEYFEHLEKKIEDLQLENEIMLLKLKESRDKLNKIKQFIYNNGIYTNGHASIDNIEGIFSTEEIKMILRIIEGEI